VKTLELVLVIAGAAALVVWRATAMYRQTFRHKDR
jgi:hypothetical protein